MINLSCYSEHIEMLEHYIVKRADLRRERQLSVGYQDSSRLGFLIVSLALLLLAPLLILHLDVVLLHVGIDLLPLLSQLFFKTPDKFSHFVSKRKIKS